MVTLLDAERSVFKSGYGIEGDALPRELSFCAHAVLSDEVLLVYDTARDVRFLDCPVVLQSPFVRFYVGALLRTVEGLPLGTLCVGDTKPRLTINEIQLQDLKDLAAEVMELLELHRSKSELAVMEACLKQQQRELNESRELWRKTDQRATLALQAGKMGYWERDAKSDLITLSASLALILGWEQRDYVFSMDEWLSGVLEEDRPRVLETLERARRTQENYLLEYRTRDQSGQERWITSSGTYRKDAAGNFAGAQGVSWDSTDAAIASRQLKMSEELFRGLSESAPVGVFRADLSGRMTYANPRTAAIFGKRAEELLGYGWFDDVHADDQGRVKSGIAAETRSDVPADNEFRLVLADGTIRWVYARASVLFNEKGEPVGKIGTLDDVTQRHQSLHDLEQAKEAAEGANRTKDMFLANVSHELRTPLNGVLGMTDMLLDTGLNREQAEMAQTIRESGRSLLTLVNDMLDVGRIEAGKIQIERLPLRLPAIIRQTVAMLDAEVKRKNLSIRVDYAPELPVYYLGDPHRIEQILLNYLSNAVKFSVAGEISIKVTGEPARQNDNREGENDLELMLSVTDAGPGIEPQAQKKLFQPFSQVDGSSTRRYGGVGLGLAISKRLAELMKGSVGLISAPGLGSTFWLRLPLTPYAEQEAPTVSPASMMVQVGGRVLLAEDNPVNQKVTLAALHKLGWEADVAANGLIAVDLFCRNEYTLVLMDCHMPEMDGFAATREIRRLEHVQSRSSIPVVALTANAMKGDRERCLAAGMNDYLAKPFGLEDIRALLERWRVTPAPVLQDRI